MHPSHTLSTRRPTGDEQRAIEKATRFNATAYGCLFLIFGIWPLATALVIIASLVGLMPAPPVWGWVLLGLLLLTSGQTFLWVLKGFRKVSLQERAKAMEDAATMLVQVIQVRHPRVVQFEQDDVDEPVLAMDIGDGKILLLHGEWLREESTYGLPELPGDPDESVVNGLPAPHAFPAENITLSRLEGSGRVLGIEVTGNYTPPETATPLPNTDGDPAADLRQSIALDISDSALIDGELTDIPGALARAGLSSESA